MRHNIFSSVMSGGVQRIGNLKNHVRYANHLRRWRMFDAFAEAQFCYTAH
jgi:hypothetical protein